MERHGTATWPGAIAVESCTYTLSHGISPGTAMLVLLPQNAPPSMTGDLVIDDGVGKIPVPNCKVSSIRQSQDGSGRIWSVAIEDRRWQWRDLGQITGCYNQLDPHGKLIPWTIRSPKELAELCLKAMGETGYEIDMPPGYTKSDGVMHGQVNPPHIGLVPKGGVNPPVDWQNEIPAHALQALCDQLGRRIVYRISSDSIKIAIAGRGDDLPSGGSIASESPSTKSPAAPETIVVVGAPTKYQAKFWLEPVGEEWDGSLVPIDRLSYRPRPAGGAVQISKATGTTDSFSPNTWQVFINAGDGDSPMAGVLFEVYDIDPDTAATSLAALINGSADPRVRGVVTAAAAGGVLTVTGTAEGKAFSFFARLNDDPVDEAFVAELAQAAVNPTGGWELSIPPDFANVEAVPGRLTYYEAKALAQKSVYRYYRLTAIHPTGNGQLIIPGFGKIDRRQQVLLLDTQVEQVAPVQIDRRLVDPNRLGLADGGGNAEFTLNFYNGYSRDKPAAMFGSTSIRVARNFGFAFWVPNADGGAENTPESAQIFVDFSIDPVEQVVKFSSPVFREVANRFYPIKAPVLLTGCHVREADNNGLRAAYLARKLPGGQPGTDAAIRKHPDVQLNLIGQYDANGNSNGARALEADAHTRAKYYLDAMQAQYLFEGALTRTYNGIEPIDCDGAIAQVTWSVGPAGATTAASRNTEHSLYVPPYPARRRAEFLPAARPPEAISPLQRIGEALMAWWTMRGRRS